MTEQEFEFGDCCTVEVSKPLECQRMLSISFENGQFIGLPKQWRETLGISRNESVQEVDIQNWDDLVGGSKKDTNRQVQFHIQSQKDKQGVYQITCENMTKKRTASVFEVRYDFEDEKEAKENLLPKEIARQLSQFKKRDFEQSPEDVVNTALRMIEGRNDIHQNIIMKMDMPTNQEFSKILSNEVVLLKEDPELKYVMLKEIGQGGFARIYLAKELATGQLVALKYMKASKKKEKQSIINEIGIMKICGQGNCPNIINCKEAYEYNKKIWIFLELMDLGALSDYLNVYGVQLTEEVISYILLHVLRGLKILHSRNIMHRDIKADNILINKQGNIKLADFGYSA